jgi:hypothetical protein
LEALPVAGAEFSSTRRSCTSERWTTRLPRIALGHDACFTPRMHDVSLAFPPIVLVRAAVASVWLYEGLWCKLLGRERRQVDVVEAVPKLGPLLGRHVLLALGVVEVAVAVWVISGLLPGYCALFQTVLLITLNANGLLWARHIIHDPGGMVVKNASFLLLAWIGAAMSGALT